MRSYWVWCVVFVCVAVLSGGPLVSVGGAQEAGDLRVDEETERLEVYYQDQWGTVCDDRFTTATANVACRQLGYAGGTFHTAGGGSGPIWLDSVECGGTETRLAECQNDGWGQHDCSHKEDVGVSCYPHPTAAMFSVSVSSAKIAEGEQTTVTVAITTEDVTFPHDLPITLTFSGNAADNDFTAPATLTLPAGDTTVTGTVAALEDFSKEKAEKIKITVAHHLLTLGKATVTIAASGPRKFALSASPAKIAEGESTTLTLTLTKGKPFKHALPVTLTFGGSAEPDDFTAPATLTFPAGDKSVTGTVAAADDAYKEGTEKIKVTATTHTWTLGKATVTLKASDPKGQKPPADGVLRLQGNTALAGRLEVYYQGQWGTVCDDRFTTVTAGVVCRQLGHAGGSFYTAGDGSGPIWLDSVECQGDETGIAACRNDGWGRHDCSHAEDVGISCVAASPSPPTALPQSILPAPVRAAPPPPRAPAEMSGAEASSEAAASEQYLVPTQSALHRAVLKGRPAVARLLKKGTAVTATDKWKNTLLHYAAAEGRPALIRFLLNKGATIDAAGLQGRTPLYYAIDFSPYEPGTSSALETLLKRGADVAAQDTHGYTSLHYAARWGAEDIVRLLLKYAEKNDVDIDVQDDGFGYTPLHEAVHQGDSKTVVKLLLEAGADTDVAEDIVGWTPLHLAAQWEPEYVRLFIKHDADVNATTDSGGTPLDAAVRAGNNKAAKLLKKAGAKHSPGFAYTEG